MGAIYLVRHGQASFGSAHYDRLSSHGEQQARLLKEALNVRGVKPVQIISGALQRQRRTAEHLAQGAGWSGPVIARSVWDEFDHEMLLDEADRGHTDAGAYQFALERGMRRWQRAARDGLETFQEFSERITRAVDHVSGDLASGDEALVVTSAGVISLMASSLLGGGVEQWILLNRVCVNTGVTTIASGRRGLSLLSFNEHGHLGRAAVTYR